MLPAATLSCRQFRYGMPLLSPGILSDVALISTKRGQMACGASAKHAMTKKVTGFNFNWRVNQLYTGNGNRRNIISAGVGRGDSATEMDDTVRKLLQSGLWAAEAVYIVWLFLLPYAPGDPVWSISSDTINSLIGLSLNFFFVLPLLNAVLCLNTLPMPYLCDKFWQSSRISPAGGTCPSPGSVSMMSEGLFNFVIAWTLLFAPLLYTDQRRDSFKGSLDVLWSFQMFLTNTFLIPYMAIRLNKADEAIDTRKKTSPLGSIMTNGGPIVGLIGGAVCLLSTLWAIYGRADGGFGGVPERLDYLVSYLGSERLAYAFIWDICLYTVFQPWLIGENLQNIRKDSVGVVGLLRFVPVVGLVAYCLCLNLDEDT